MAKSEVEEVVANVAKPRPNDEAPDDWRTDSIKGYKIDKPKRSRWWIYPLILLIILGSGAGFYWLINREPAAPNETSQNQAVASETPLLWPEQPTELIYAYKEDSQTFIRSVNLSDGKKADLFEFEERLEVGDDGEVGPSASLTPDGKSLAFVDEIGLKIWDMVSKTSRDLIVRANPRSINTPDWSLDFKDNNPQVQDLLRPVWSIGGANIGITRLHSDNTSVAVHRADNAGEIDLGETLNSNEEDKELEYRFFVKTGREELKDTRLFPELYLDFQGGELCGAIFSPDASRIAACVAPNIEKDGAIAPNDSAKRDLIIVNAADLSFQRVASDYFTGSLAISQDGSLLIASAHVDTSTGELTILSFDISTVDFVSLTRVLPLKDSFSVAGTIEATTLYIFDKPYRTVVETSDGTGRHAIIIDINAQDQMADFWVDDRSHLELLGVR